MVDFFPLGSRYFKLSLLAENYTAHILKDPLHTHAKPYRKC